MGKTEMSNGRLICAEMYKCGARWPCRDHRNAESQKVIDRPCFEMVKCGSGIPCIFHDIPENRGLERWEVYQKERDKRANRLALQTLPHARDIRHHERAPIERKGDSITAKTRESVNVAAVVGHTKGGWIGLNLYVMCPNDETAKAVLSAAAKLVREMNHPHVADVILQELETALLRDEEKILEDRQLWPERAHPLSRTRHDR